MWLGVLRPRRPAAFSRATARVSQARADEGGAGRSAGSSPGTQTGVDQALRALGWNSVQAVSPGAMLRLSGYSDPTTAPPCDTPGHALGSKQAAVLALKSFHFGDYSGTQQAYDAKMRSRTEDVSPSGVSSSRPLCSSRIAERAAAIALCSTQHCAVMRAALVTKPHAHTWQRLTRCDGWVGHMYTSDSRTGFHMRPDMGHQCLTLHTSLARQF